jgi:Ca-activated chloride channel family protein
MDKRDLASGDATPQSRLDVVKQVVGRFVEKREADRISLIVFGSQAYVQVPFTRDHATVRAMLDATDVGMAGPHTAVGDAIGLAIHTFERSDVEDRLLIVLTDGADTGSRMSPLNAAEIAAENGVRIFTVAFGDPMGQGENRVDFQALREIAERTNGMFFAAGDATGLKAIYDEIDRIAPQIFKTLSYVPRQSLAQVPLALALVIGLVTVGSMSLFARRKVAA